MKKAILIFCFIPFFTQATNVLDILKSQDTASALQKELKKDIGSVFPLSNKPYNFIKAFENNNFNNALSLWLKSVKNTPFSKSSTGEALYAYLLFKNRFEILALKNLFEKSEPSEINPIVSKLWKAHIKEKHPVWDHFFFPVSQKWHEFFDEDIIFKIGSKAPLQLKKDQEYIKSLLELPLSEKTDAFFVEWSFVLSLIQQADMDAATKILSWLTKKTKDQYKKDMIHLTIGRLLADIEETKASLNYYSKIKKPSYFWLLAQEEMAWILLNKGNYNNAYSTASVFEYPEFKKESSPHMLFVLALSQLKNCDYKGLTRSVFDFKSLFSKRKTETEQILSSDSHKLLIKKLSKFYNSGTPYYMVGKSDLLYQLRKDEFLKNHILLDQYIKNQQMTRSIKFKLLDKTENKITKQLEAQIKSRLQVLLNREIEKINFILKHFQMLEAEALYRIHGFHSLLPVKISHSSRSLQTLTSFSQTKGMLYFPFDPKEIWLDELADYRSEALKNCPKGNYVL